MAITFPPPELPPAPARRPTGVPRGGLRLGAHERSVGLFFNLPHPFLLPSLPSQKRMASESEWLRWRTLVSTSIHVLISPVGSKHFPSLPLPPARRTAEYVPRPAFHVACGPFYTRRPPRLLKRQRSSCSPLPWQGVVPWDRGWQRLQPAAKWGPCPMTVRSSYRNAAHPLLYVCLW